MHASLLVYVLALGFYVTLASKQTADKDALNFQLTSSGNENYFYRDNITSAQVLLTSPASNATRRLVAALPAGNNGALVYFLPASTNSGVASEDKLDITLINGTLKSTTSPFHNVGIQADILVTANATLGVTIVGSVRALRDYVEGSGTVHSIFNYSLLSHSSTEVRLHRQYINSTAVKLHGRIRGNEYKSVDLELSIPTNSDARFYVVPSSNQSTAGPPPRIDILVHPVSTHDKLSRSIVRVKVLTNETSLTGLSSSEFLLFPDSDAVGSNTALQNVLKGLQEVEENASAVNQVSFLSFQDKFTAGGWRFLTYFGRDTMIALRLLMPLMSPSAIESALGAVIERANSTGALCHEETIGDYASFVNINNNHSELGNAPFYDYKMIDTDLLLLPALAHYLLDLPQGGGRAQSFLSKNASLQNGTYKDILNRIATYTTGRAIPFSLSPNFSNLLSFRPGEPVGNWRDSNEGNGYGRTPFDVNVALVSANLRALDRLVAAGFLDGAGGVQDLGGVAQVWEDHAESLFRVSVPGNVAEQRLEDFVQQVGLGSMLLNSTNTTNNVEFYALSLKDDGSPVEVLNSDLSFQLMYGTNISSYFMQRVVDALTPYPRGLLTNIGMVVANPAFDSNRTNLHVLDRTSYHGTVVWSFQQALMAAGLARQLGFCSNDTTAIDTNPMGGERPVWCGDSVLIEQLQDAQARLWGSINGAPDERFTEVWSYVFNNATGEFSVADLASLSPTGTESDAIQLWSYGFLGLVDPTNATRQGEV